MACDLDLSLLRPEAPGHAAGGVGVEEDRQLPALHLLHRQHLLGVVALSRAAVRVRLRVDDRSEVAVWVRGMGGW